MQQSRIARWLRDVSVIALCALLLTLALRIVLERLMDIPLEARWFWRDALGNLAVLLVFWALIRRLVPTLSLGLGVVSFLQITNGIKLRVLGVPSSPDDFFNVGNLVFLTEGLVRIGVIAALALPFVLLVWLMRWRSLVTWMVVAVLAASVVLTIQFSKPLRATLDRTFGNSVWNQPGNFRQRGLALHLVQESVRTAAKVGKAPPRVAVQSALAERTEVPVDTAGIDGRNVHMIVLESFFDPMTLGPEWVPEDPFPAAFRELWKAAGHSVALSPVFGGYTANAEFEALCGYPVTENAVFFEGWLRRQVPCLPSVLDNAGYRTVASHPNVPGFWNRTHAYQLTGFQEYLSKADFDLTDSVKGLLLDHSYFDQLFEQLGPLDASPLFNYALTYFGHLPFPVDESYPDRVPVGRDAPLLQGYLNHVWYKSRDLMARLAILRTEDPDALIVIFGDHLPYLDPNYGVYSEVLDLPAQRDAFTGNQLEFLISAPLIVIDGQRGPIDVGKVPLFRLPSLILERLGASADGMFAWSAPTAEASGGRLMRPVYGMHIEVQPSIDSDDVALVCRPEEEAEECADGLDWLARTRILIGDIFTGHQYSLETLAVPGES